MTLLIIINVQCLNKPNKYFMTSHQSSQLYFLPLTLEQGDLGGIQRCYFFQMLCFFHFSENQVLKMTAETKASVVCPSSGWVLKWEWSDEM